MDGVGHTVLGGTDDLVDLGGQRAEDCSAAIQAAFRTTPTPEVLREIGTPPLPMRMQETVERAHGGVGYRAPDAPGHARSSRAQHLTHSSRTTPLRQQNAVHRQHA